MGLLGQAARNDSDRVVATIAVTRELDAFGTDQDVNAGAVERRTEGVGVQGLPPLVVGLFVAVSAIFGLGKSTGPNEIVGLGGGVTRKRKVIFAETKIVGLADLFRVIRAVESAVGLSASNEVYRSQKRGGAHHDASDDAG